MTIRDVAASVTIGGNSMSIISLSVTEDFATACTRFTLVTNTSSGSINDLVNISLGYSGDLGTMMTNGRVDTITANRPPGTYTIEGRDKLKMAMDYFIVVASNNEADFFNPRLDNGSDNPHEIVDDILGEAGLSLTWWTGDAGWTLGDDVTGTPFQLKTAWESIQEVCMIGVWKVWVRQDGDISFGQIVPEPGVSSGSFTTGDSGNLTSISYSKSDEELRNKIIVIGAPTELGNGAFYTGTASASSPYLPTGYYKTAVISTDLLTSASDCYDSALLNRNRFNRLTERVSFEAEGDHSIHIHDTVYVEESFTGLAEDWFVYQITHSIDDGGYRMSGVLSK